MGHHQINFVGWVLFMAATIGFIIASIGSFWAMFGAAFFALAYIIFVIPFARNGE